MTLFENVICFCTIVFTLFACRYFYHFAKWGKQITKREKFQNSLMDAAGLDWLIRKNRITQERDVVIAEKELERLKEM